MDSDDKRHEILISSIDEMEGQVVNQHMFPFERFYELKQAFDDHDI